MNKVRWKQTLSFTLISYQEISFFSFNGQNYSKKILNKTVLLLQVFIFVIIFVDLFEIYEKELIFEKIILLFYFCFC